ncbi:hypothetical protein Rs2_21617 [Raphanus sativus]|nr:hypothetical protein Rs2_21617 [Raphanus sativus]
MVGKSGKKVTKVRWSSASGDPVAAQSACVKSPRYPVSDSTPDAVGSSKEVGVAGPDSRSIARTLAGSDHLETILQSQFGRLFQLPVARCHNSAKLVGDLVCRQFVTDRKYELWFHFATHPLCFSLDEFQEITGLNCAPFDVADSEDDVEPGSAMWQQLFDTSLGDITVAQVLLMLKNPGLPEWKRVPLALIALVDGVICCSNKNLKLTPKYVEMLCDHDYFFSYPWGKELFMKTLPRLLPPYASENPLREMRVRLSQKTTVAYGFPLALQLFAFQKIPLLLAQIPNSHSADTFLVNPEGCDNAIAILKNNDIVHVEEDPDLTVDFTPIPESERYLWLDDRLDVHVTRLVEALQSGYQFQKTDFPGGDASFAPVLEGGLQNPDAAPTGRPVKSRNLRTCVRTATASQAPPVHQRNLRPRKPRVVVIDSLSSSSSEDGQREGPSEPVRCTHVDLKPWLDQKFEQLAKSFRNHVDELFRNSSCSRCGFSEPRVERARKRKSDEDRSVPSGSFKGVDPEAVPSKRMAKRPKTAPSTPGPKKHEYSLCSVEDKGVSDDVHQGPSSPIGNIDRCQDDDDPNEGFSGVSPRNESPRHDAITTNVIIRYQDPVYILPQRYVSPQKKSTIDQRSHIPVGSLKESFKDATIARDLQPSSGQPDCEVPASSTANEGRQVRVDPNPLPPIVEDSEGGTPAVEHAQPLTPLLSSTRMQPLLVYMSVYATAQRWMLLRQPFHLVP